MIHIHVEQERGVMSLGWLHARYSFSFARYYNPDRMGHGALRVWNHDTVAPGRGFDPHSHKDFEIITIPLRGSVAHSDSTGAEGVVSFGQVQTMSAGTGVTHSEYNASDTEELELFQLWIETELEGRDPQYSQHEYDTSEHGIQVLASREQGGGYIETSSVVSFVNAEKEDIHIPTDQKYSYFLMPISGSIMVGDYKAKPFDSLEIAEENQTIVVTKGTQAYMVQSLNIHKD